MYDLPERVIPAALLDHEPSDEECLAYLVASTVRALGVATQADVTEYQRLNWLSAKPGTAVVLDEAAAAAGLTPVTLVNGTHPGSPGKARRTGRPTRAWADPAALAWLDAGGRGMHRTTLLSPFDSLIWDRKRTLRMFGYQHALEAYVPKEKRVHGYYTMPLLAGGQIVGGVDPARSGKTLIARHVMLDKEAAAGPMARALAEAASWVGCDGIYTERVSPPALAQPLATALKAEGFS